MTIKEAIIKVLENHPEGLDANDIYTEILANGYYNFGAKKPKDVVRIESERMCEGTSISDSNKNKVLVYNIKDGKKLFKLKYLKGVVMDDNKKYNCISTSINGIQIYTFVMKVNDLANISYVAVRGKDSEEGSVQRVLNKKRITSIKDYVLDGNMFVTTFVLNWTNTKNPPIIKTGTIELPIICGSAQLIDGQHRLEGIKLAISEKPEIADKEIIVSMAINLETTSAAEIFLNINSEQKPVPKSLIYDLYGITRDERNYAEIRAQDIANNLNTNDDSPFYNVIKYPGSPRGKGKLDLSTVVNALKKYVDHDGKLEENNIASLDAQTHVIQNYFKALKYHADKSKKWSIVTNNIFFKAAGFIGAINFFMDYVLPKCVEKRSFKEETISQLFDFDGVELITPADIVSTDGRTARIRVVENLKEAFITNTPGEEEYEI